MLPQRKAWIHTFKGREIDLENPQPDDIDPDDIAHALALINRFTGHSMDPYTVGQHCCVASIMAAELYPQHPWLPHAMLLHDATEAYVGDVSSPLKSLLPGYKAIEAKFQDAIERRFMVSLDDPLVHEIDLRMLATEKDKYMPKGGSPWTLPHPPFTVDEFSDNCRNSNMVTWWSRLWGYWTHNQAEDMYQARMWKLGIK